MIELNEQQIYKDAIGKYGVESQLDMVVEECAELIQAISKFKRSYGRSIQNVIEEMADVDIMLNQLKIIVEDFNQLDLIIGEEEGSDYEAAKKIVGFYTMKYNKLIRLRDRLNENNTKS